jgi:Tfp pilus assembly protein PilO
MTAETIVSIVAMVLVAILGLVVNGYRSKIGSLENEIKEIRRDYVRRDDLNGHLKSIAESMSDIKENMKELTKLTLAGIAASSDRK